MQLKEVIQRFEELADSAHKAKMSYFGIDDEKAYGIRLPDIRSMAKVIKKDHDLAQDLWDFNKHESRLLASMIADPKQCTEAEMEKWVLGIRSWDLCDQLCTNYWVHTEQWFKKKVEWIDRDEEFVKRAGYVLYVTGLIKRKKLPDAAFRPALAWIERDASDARNFVKKAVNWLLREFGKRRPELRPEVIALAERLSQSETQSARWIGSDALREFHKKGFI